MKKSLLFVSLAILFSLSSYAGDVVVSNFETGDTAFYVSGASMKGTIVTNPSKTGINVSDKALQVVVGGTWNQSLKYYSKTPFNFYTNPTLSFKVYATDTMSFFALFDNDVNWTQQFFTNEFPGNGTADFTISGDKIGKWVEFTYDLSRWSKNGYNHLAIGSSSRTGTIYIDDVKFLQRSPAFSGSTVVPIFYTPVTTIKWVGDWVGYLPATTYNSANSYGSSCTNVSYLSTDTIKLSPNGYMAWPNDTIKGSSGGAAYALASQGHPNDTLTFTKIPTGGVKNLSLKFDLAVLKSVSVTGKAPKVEVKFLDSTNWEPALTLTNLPTIDSTWTTVTSTISGAGKSISIRFTNILPKADTALFWIDDISLLGTTTPTDSIAPAGEDGLKIVTVGGNLQMVLNSYPTDAADDATWSVGASSTTYVSIDGNGLLVGKAATDKALVIAKTTDGTDIVDSVYVKVQAESIKATYLVVTSNVESLSYAAQFAIVKAKVKPGNATNKSFAWSVDSTQLATVGSNGVVRALKNGTVVVKATASDGSNATGTKSFVITDFPVEVDSTEDAVKELSKNGISVFPNPVIESLQISSKEPVTKAEVINLVGDTKIVLTDNGISSVSVAKLAVGTYILRLTTKDGNVSVVKFSKQ